MLIEWVPIDSIRPYDHNPRKNDDAVDAVAESIKQFGWQQAIVVDKNNVVVCGHTRLKAAKKLGINKVPVKRADELTDEQIKAYRLADNKTSELSGWDFAKLDEELSEISGIDMSAFGFDIQDISINDVTEDDIPEIEDTEPTVKRGEIWQLGEHRLMCGDSTLGEDITKLMNGEKADMVFTDPPYGVAIGDKNKFLNEFGRGGWCEENIIGDTASVDDLRETLTKAFVNLRTLAAKEECAYYVSSPQGGELGEMMMMMMRSAGLGVRHVLVWVKNTAAFSLGRLDYDYRHEPIFYTWTKKHNFYGSTDTSVFDDSVAYNKLNKKELIEIIQKLLHPKEDSVIYVDKPLSSRLHPTMKPIKLIARFIRNSSRQGDAVADIFGGSGSTLIACEQMNRRCYMMELDEHYCDVIIKRWETLTGKKAVKIE